eukprot:gene3140-5456_t
MKHVVKRTITERKHFARSVTFPGIDAFKGKVDCYPRCDAYLMIKEEYEKFKEGSAFTFVQGLKNFRINTWRIVEDPDIFEKDLYLVIHNPSGSKIDTTAEIEQTPPVDGGMVSIIIIAVSIAIVAPLIICFFCIIACAGFCITCSACFLLLSGNPTLESTYPYGHYETIE